MKNIFGRKLTALAAAAAVSAGAAVMPALSASAEDAEIKTAAELVSLAAAVNGGDSYEGRTVKLANDIDLSGTEWTPIGSQDSDGFKINAFAGTFDGGGHSIKGLHISSSNGKEQGLFGIVSGTVKNLTVEGEITASSAVGGIAGWSYGSIINCTSNVDITARREAGGIAGTLSSGGYIEACENKGDITITNKETYAGGIAGQNNRGFVLNCKNSGKIENGSAETQDAFRNKIGGIVGYLNSGKIENGDNSGDVVSYETVASYTADTTHNYVGGIVGYSEGGTVIYSDNSGTVHNAVNYAGGVAGYLQSRDNVMYCSNSGAVTGGTYAGGIAAYSRADIAVCENTGKVTASSEDGYAGGVAAYLSSGTINNCTYTNNDDLEIVGGKEMGKIITAEAEKPTAPPVSPTTPPEGGGTEKISVYAEDGIIIVATYDENEALSRVEIRGEVRANEEVRELDLETGQKAFIWTSFEEMKPVSVIEKDAE